MLAPTAPARAGEALATEAQRLGYSIGYQVGGDFRRDGLPLDIELLVEGVRHALDGADPRLSREQMRESLTGLQNASEAVRSPDAGEAETP
jgi:FKBP-type peptidyl-prolyl cis-trans isomerase FklB